jgi:hypothetical protein
MMETTRRSVYLLFVFFQKSSHKGFLNTNTTITRQLMRTARMLEAEWRQVLRGSIGTGTKEDESSTGRVLAAECHHVKAHSCSVRILKLMNRLFL